MSIRIEISDLENTDKQAIVLLSNFLKNYVDEPEKSIVGRGASSENFVFLDEEKLPVDQDNSDNSLDVLFDEDEEEEEEPKEIVKRKRKAREETKVAAVPPPPPPPPIAPLAPSITYKTITEKLQVASYQKKIKKDQVNKILKSVGLSNLTALSIRPDLFVTFDSRVNELLS